MIASHMIACLFTELNQNQVQKVSQHERGRLARFGPSCVLSGNLDRVGDLVSSSFGAGDVEPVWVAGKVLGMRSHVC